MGLNHAHCGSPEQVRAGRAYRIAIGLTGGFMIVEFAVGFAANSVALVSDALHMLTDSASLGVALFANWVACHPVARQRFPRIELWAALFSGFWVVVLAGRLIVEAVGRLETPPTVEGLMVLPVAVLGLAVNVLVMRVLRAAPQNAGSASALNMRAVILHVMFDLLGSLAAIVSGAVVLLTGWGRIDPIAGGLIGVLVAVSSVAMVADAAKALWRSRAP
jgi:cobalt-zinc-cadmium efflux system protein